MIDLSKLTPVPWAVGPITRIRDGHTTQCFVSQQEILAPNQEELDNEQEEPSLDNDHRLPIAVVSVDEFTDDAAFIALARNAFNGDSEALAWWEANRRK